MYTACLLTISHSIQWGVFTSPLDTDPPFPMQTPPEADCPDADPLDAETSPSREQNDAQV